MSEQRRRERPELPPTSLGWKLWFGFVLLISLGMVGLLGWLAVDAILYLQRH